MEEFHLEQWTSTLETYVYPIIGDMYVDEIVTDDICRRLRPIWTAKAETAHRVRGRVERVLDAAMVLKLRSGANPAHLASNMALLLPKQEKKKLRVKNHPAIAVQLIGPRPLGSLPREAGWSAATSCHGPLLP